MEKAAARFPHLRFFLEDQHHRPPHGADVQRLIGRVQDQDATGVVLPAAPVALGWGRGRLGWSRYWVFARLDALGQWCCRRGVHQLRKSVATKALREGSWSFERRDLGTAGPSSGSVMWRDKNRGFEACGP